MAEKQPTVDTCVLSGKPIRQKHLDDNLVIPYGKGRAFIAAIQNTIQSPPDNAVVFAANQVSVVSLSYKRFKFPSRIELKGKLFKTFPKFIYIQNQMFKFHKTSSIQSFESKDSLKDMLLEVGIVVYIRTKERPPIKQAIEKTYEENKEVFKKLAEGVDKAEEN